VVRAFLDTVDGKLVSTLCINAIDDKGDIEKHPQILEQAFALGVELASGDERGGSV